MVARVEVRKTFEGSIGRFENKNIRIRIPFTTPHTAGRKPLNPEAVATLKEICKVFKLGKIVYRYKDTYLEAEVFAGLGDMRTLEQLEAEINTTFAAKQGA